MAHCRPLQPPPGHTPATPSAPQALPSGQSPQCSTLPQPSPMSPQYRPALASSTQVRGVQLGTVHSCLISPLPHSPPAGQSPQSKVPPQPSPTLPQYRVLPASQVFLTQL